MKRILPRVLLSAAGLLLLIIGSSVLFTPVSFATANGFELPTMPSALSEYRAPGGMLLVSGLIMLLGAVQSHLTRFGLMLAGLVYSSYGISRLVGVAMDGMPSVALIQAMAIELLVGSLCLATLLVLKPGNAESGQR